MCLMDGLGLEIAFDNLSARLVVIELFCLVISVLYHQNVSHIAPIVVGCGDLPW